MLVVDWNIVIATNANVKADINNTVGSLNMLEKVLVEDARGRLEHCDGDKCECQGGHK
jgi:hypothetical protein